MAIKRLRDLGIAIGERRAGHRTDDRCARGARWSHDALAGEDVRTGVTAIWPHDGHPVLERLYAGLFSLNGLRRDDLSHRDRRMGASMSTPIALTGTGSVGLAMHTSPATLPSLSDLARDPIPRFPSSPNVTIASFTTT